MMIQSEYTVKLSDSTTLETPTEFFPDPGYDWAECLCRLIDPSNTPCVVCEARFVLPMCAVDGTRE